MHRQRTHLLPTVSLSDRDVGGRGEVIVDSRIQCFANTK